MIESLEIVVNYELLGCQFVASLFIRALFVIEINLRLGLMFLLGSWQARPAKGPVARRDAKDVELEVGQEGEHAEHVGSEPPRLGAARRRHRGIDSRVWRQRLLQPWVSVGGGHVCLTGGGKRMG